MKNLYDYERTQSATTDLPFGALKNESSPGKQDGTDIVAEHIQDLAYSLYQVLQLAGINPNGELEDGNNKTQFIESLTNIGVFRYSDKTSYNYGVFAWQVIGNTFTLYRSLKNSNSDDVNNNESWLKILEIGADNKINFNVDTNILGLSANPSLSNLSEAGEDRLNVSKMYETGAVSTDTKGFEIISRLAHSTFDESKFTIKGSPIITDDGIASGFSKVNYAYCQNNKIDLTRPFKISIATDFIYKSGTAQALFQIVGATTWSNYVYIGDTINMPLQLSDGVDGGKTLSISHTKTNHKYIISFEWTGTEYILQAKDLETGELKESKYSSELLLYGVTENSRINFGYDNHSGYYWTGSIDLKSIAIWADGIPVFNGNKTGLFVAKPDNYTVVGSPTISDDGVASGFSGSNTIKGTVAIDWSKPFIFKIACTTPKSITADFATLTGLDLTAPVIRLSAGKWSLRSVGDTITDTENAKLDTKYWIKLEGSSDGIIFSKSVDGINYTNIGKTSQVNYTEPSIPYFGIYATSDARAWEGTIDLNSIKISVDGNLVYQPCLKIPYTETFEHPKVVDVAYRDRVQDLYEQTGESLFYTIDEQNQNFTLPAGDIYGMITKNREILDIVYPIGRPMPEENNVLLDNEVWLEGATVNLVDYPKLFKVYGTKYGGDGITTFVLPDMRGRTLWGSPDGSNGYIEAKLPNIKGGSVLHSQDADGALNGCFYTTRSSISGNAQFPSNGRSYATFGAGINANLSNEIYSDDATTVQPPAFKVRWKTRFE